MQDEKKGATTTDLLRKKLHQWLNIICDDSLPDVEWCLQSFVAHTLNRRYDEERAQQPTTARPR